MKLRTSKRAPKRPAKSPPLEPDRIDNPSVIALSEKISQGAYERVLLCEGDSWFDIYTPFPLHEPNLLDALRTSRKSLLVDVSHVGDTAKEMATGAQAARTLNLLNEFKFDALLLSAGGNDLKNVFREAFVRAIVHAEAGTAMPEEIRVMTSEPSKADDVFEEIVGCIVDWINLRQKSKLNKSTPVVLHGYDYMQPRPAPARATVDGRRVSGPWLYCALHAKGLTDEQMRKYAAEVIDTLNRWLMKLVKPLPNVHLLDTRNTLTLAEPGTKKRSNDWMDEIHPHPDGWAKLAKKWWNPELARILA